MNAFRQTRGNGRVRFPINPQPETEAALLDSADGIYFQIVPDEDTVFRQNANLPGSMPENDRIGFINMQILADDDVRVADVFADILIDNRAN